MVRLRSPAPILATLLSGSVPERPKGADCKSVVNDFAGPNPATPITKRDTKLVSLFVICEMQGFEADFDFVKNLVRSFAVSRSQLVSVGIGKCLAKGENPATPSTLRVDFIQFLNKFIFYFYC